MSLSPELASLTSQVPKNPWLRLCFSRTSSEAAAGWETPKGGPSQVGGLVPAIKSDLKQLPVQGPWAASLGRTCVA